jgi:hypothetical protein
MAQIQIPVDLGFTEFVTTLLSEVVSSIAATQSDQTQRIAELTAAASLSLEEFAAAHVPDPVLDDHLARLFPATDPDRPHEVVSGAPYQPARGQQPEHPPYEQVLGVRLTGSDVNADKQTLLARGVGKIREAARLQVAEQQQDVARALLERGIPKVVVDAGRISAKLTFEALQSREEDSAASASEAPAISGPTAFSAVESGRLIGAHEVVMLERLPRLDVTPVLSKVLEDVRLLVRPADDRRPETGTTRANVYGEVELTFKTVT